MGIKFAPAYAILTLGFLEETILYPRLSSCLGDEVSLYVKNYFYRYIDDCFILWPKSFPSPDTLLPYLNNMNVNIKFTSCYSTVSLPFLDVLVKIESNAIITDLYRKPTDTMNFLHLYSCHPGHIKRNIPFNVSRRICTIIQDPNLRQTIDLMKLNLFF